MCRPIYDDTVEWSEEAAEPGILGFCQLSDRGLTLFVDSPNCGLLVLLLPIDSPNCGLLSDLVPLLPIDSPNCGLLSDLAPVLPVDNPNCGRKPELFSCIDP